MSDIPNTPGHVEAIDDLARTAVALGYERMLTTHKRKREAVAGWIIVLILAGAGILFLPTWAALLVTAAAISLYLRFALTLIQRLDISNENRAAILQKVVDWMRTIKITPEQGQAAEFKQIVIVAATSAPAGRKPQEAYDVAWREIQTKTTMADAYQHYLERTEKKHDDNQRKAFDQAMRSRSRK